MLKNTNLSRISKKILTFVVVKIYYYGECSKTHFRRERI